MEKAPTQWAPDRNIAWRAEIPGYGQSAPVVWGDTVFLTSSNGPWQESGFVHAFDLQTGKRRWTTEVPATTKVENYFRNSRAAPTSVVDADVVVSLFPGGDVTAMSHDGKTLWSVPLFRDHGGGENERATGGLRDGHAKPVPPVCLAGALDEPIEVFGQFRQQLGFLHPGNGPDAGENLPRQRP